MVNKLVKRFCFIIKYFLFHAFFLNPVLAGNGPSKPEASQFEPIDVTDMVDLFTGDFTYSIPLMEVPGPGGGWPINLMYHAGIGPNTEATWVGLGWNLNPGAINRVPSGYPDDFYYGNVASTYQSKVRSQRGYGIGFGWGPFGMNLNFMDGKGFSGINATISVISAIMTAANIKAGYPIEKAYQKAVNDSPVDMTVVFGRGGGVGFSAKGAIGSTGFSATASIFMGNDGTASVSSGLNADGQNLLGVSYSAKNGGNYSIHGAGFSAMSKSAEDGVNVRGFNSSFSIPLPGGFSLSFSSYEQFWWLYDVQAEKAFGAIHQEGYFGNSIENYWGQDNYHSQYNLLKTSNSEIENIGIPIPQSQGNNKGDRIEGDQVSIPGEDSYSVSAPGISGQFKPFFDNPVKYFDGGDFDSKGKLINEGINGVNRKANIHWQFLGEPGNNQVMNTASLGFQNYQNIDSGREKFSVPRIVDQEWFGFSLI